ncbi:MAG: hypothetical protein CMJ34_02255 [Phycisphaerae bacterium]|nr:hypothetical protein [Phycisphaerae bacterium]
MRILHYIQSVDFRNGGPPRAVVDQVATMRSRGHDSGLATTVVRDVPAEWMERAEDGLPEVVRLGPVRGPLSRLDGGSVSTIREAVRRYDIVHLHGVWEPANLQVAAACRDAGTPYVISLRGMLDDWSMDQSGLRKRLYLFLGGRSMLERAAAVHCTADAELAQSRKWFPKGRGAVVPNLMDMAPYAEVPDPAEARSRWPELASGDFSVLFLSRVQHKKGLEHLIDALAILAKGSESPRLMIAGTGDDEYEARMRSRVTERGLEHRVSWLGHVGGDLKNSLFAACDVFALPTSQENFGFVFFESLACGTPVITTDLVDTRDEIERSGGGIIIPQDAAAFAEAVASIRDGSRDPLAMGTSGREWTLKNLSTAEVSSRFEKLYESCISDSR